MTPIITSLKMPHAAPYKGSSMRIENDSRFVLIQLSCQWENYFRIIIIWNKQKVNGPEQKKETRPTGPSPKVFIY